MADKALKRIKIALIAGGLKTGGAERQIIFFCKAMKNAGHDVQVYSLTKGDVNEHFLFEAGIPVFYFGKFKNAFLRILYLAFLIVKGKRPNLIISFHGFTNLYSGIVGKILNIPSFGGIRGQADRFLAIYGSRLGRFLLNITDFLIANSISSFRQIQDLSLFRRERGIILNNVIDLEGIPVQVKKINQEDTTRILFTGRLITEKGIWDLLEAMSLLKTEVRNKVSLKIVGGGSEEVAVKNFAEKELADSDIVFLGQLSIEQVYQELKGADLFVFPSHSEGFPNSVLEAMAFSLPIIASRVGDIPELIEDGRSGWLVDPKSPIQISNKITELVESMNEAREAGILARKAVEVNYSAAMLAERVSMVIFQKIDRNINSGR